MTVTMQHTPLAIARLSKLVDVASARIANGTATQGAAASYAIADSPAIRVTDALAPALARWQALRSAWGLSDRPYTPTAIHALGMCPVDGRIYKTVDLPGLRYTRHAWGQLWALLGRSHAATRLGDSPWTRASAFQDLAAQRRRDSMRDVLFRIARANPDEWNPRNGYAIRGVVSAVYATEFDDAPTLATLVDWAGIGTEGTLDIRSDWDRTVARLTLGRETGTVADTAIRTLTVSNSEVGLQSLQARGEIHIRALDTDTEEQRVYLRAPRPVTITRDSDASTLRHTLPRAGRTQAAADRANAAFTKAFEGATELHTAWVRAMALQISPRDCTDAVLVDWVLERVGLPGAAVPMLTNVVSQETRLSNLPRGTLAHVVGALALVAQRAGLTPDQAGATHDAAVTMLTSAK